MVFIGKGFPAIHLWFVHRENDRILRSLKAAAQKRRDLAEGV